MTDLMQSATSRLISGLIKKHLRKATEKTIIEIGILDPARVSSLIPSPEDVSPGTVGAWNAAIAKTQAADRMKLLG